MSIPSTLAESPVKIPLRNLTKSFQSGGGTVTALDNMSLDIPTGCFFMIVGPSGCGKSTLLRMLANLEAPTSGTIEISAPAEKRPGNSMVFQGDSLFPWMTVWDNAAYGLTLRGVPKSQIR